MEKRDRNNHVLATLESRPRLTLLNPAALAKRCQRSHLRPSPDLSAFVSVAWTLQWSLADGEAFVQRVLPDPCVQIVVATNGAQILGVVTGGYAASFTGAGFILGLKFRPGAFYPFLRRPVSELTDRTAPLVEIFPGADPERLKLLACAGDGPAVMNALECLLRNARPTVELGLQQVLSFTERIAGDPEILTVEHAAQAFGLSSRTLQRLFRKYTGVTPKWMIRRYRIQEAAARVESGDIENWTGLALQLGYYDQAHLINDFTALTGQPPAEYAKSIRDASG